MSITNYYATGSTANGYVSLLESNLIGFKKILFIKGEINYSSLYDGIKSLWDTENSNLEFIYNPFDNNSFEALLNKDKGVAVVFDIHKDAEINLKGFENLEVIDFGKAIDCLKLIQKNEIIMQYKKASQACLDNAYLFFNKALKIHDEWENIYIENMDFEKADTLAQEVLNKLVGEKKLNKHSVVKHRFLGAATPEGAKDFIPSITQDIPKRYFIKGRPGTGKSTLLKKLAKGAENSGFDVEIYHCGFDHNSLDMVVITELGVCIFDSSAPHEHFPSRENDEIVDVYARIIKPNTDEKYTNELSEIALRYKSNIRIANAYLATMKAINEVYKKCYDNCIDIVVYNRIFEEVISKL